MSDLPELGLRRMPGAEPRPEVLQAIVTRGRRRLRRAALGGTGALATVVGLALGTALLGGGTDDALTVVPASPMPGVEATPSPEGAAPAPTPAATQAPPGVAAPSYELPPVRPGTAGGPGVADSDAAATSDDEAAPAAQQPRPRPGQPLPAHRDEPSSSGFGDTCLGRWVDNASPGYRLCLETRTSTTVTPGTPVSITLNVCSSLSNPADLRLAFDSGREHDARIRRGGTADDYVWTWSRHYRFPQGPHERVLPRGQCLNWKATWSTRDDAGDLVPPGEYYVDSSIDVNGREHVVQQPFRVAAPE